MNIPNERFNRIVQKDFIDYEEDLLAGNQRLFNHRLEAHVLLDNATS